MGYVLTIVYDAPLMNGARSYHTCPDTFGEDHEHLTNIYKYGGNRQIVVAVTRHDADNTPQEWEATNTAIQALSNSDFVIDKWPDYQHAYNWSPSYDIIAMIGYIQPMVNLSPVIHRVDITAEIASSFAVEQRPGKFRLGILNMRNSVKATQLASYIRQSVEGYYRQFCLARLTSSIKNRCPLSIQIERSSRLGRPMSLYDRSIDAMMPNAPRLAIVYLCRQVIWDHIGVPKIPYMETRLADWIFVHRLRTTHIYAIMRVSGPYQYSHRTLVDIPIACVNELFGPHSKSTEAFGREFINEVFCVDASIVNTDGMNVCDDIGGRIDDLYKWVMDRAQL